MLYTKQEIADYLNFYKWAENYTVNEDLTVDVAGDVEIPTNENLARFPFKFGKVTGFFYCQGNQLISLMGAPHTVGKTFNCMSNNLTTLEGGPRKVGGFFYCSKNLLTTLTGAPSIVGEAFDCSFNQLNSLEGSPEEIAWYFDCYDNPLESLGNIKTKLGGIFCSSEFADFPDYKEHQGKIYVPSKKFNETVLASVEKRFLENHLAELPYSQNKNFDNAHTTCPPKKKFKI